MYDGKATTSSHKFTSLMLIIVILINPLERKLFFFGISLVYLSYDNSWTGGLGASIKYQ